MPVKTDGTWTAASSLRQSQEFSCPIPGVNVAYILKQVYCQLLANWTPLALNTAHPDYTDFVLVEEGDRQPLGAGAVQWTRTYAKKPDSHDEFETFAYNFIGFYGSYGPNEILPTGRDRVTKVVNSRIANEYFLVGTGGDYPSAGDIPVNRAQAYYVTSESQLTDWLADSPPFTVATTPNRTTYESYMANAVLYGWNSNPVSSSTKKAQIVVQDSSVARWLGNIWRRQTRYVLAE